MACGSQGQRPAKIAHGAACAVATDTTKKCQANGERCTKCSGFPHLARVCKYRQRAHSMDKEDNNCTASSEEFFIGSMDKVAANDWTVDLTAKGTFIRFRLGTGAQANELPETALTLKEKPFTGIRR